MNGLYASTGKLINADVNGAIGIARKLIGDDWITESSPAEIRGVVLRLVRTMSYII